MGTGEVRNGVFLAHRTALIDYATPILGSREAAEDIVHDAFLRFVPSPARISSPEQTLAYLYRIVRNLAFDVLRRRKVEGRESARGVPYWAMPREEKTPEQSLLLCDQLRLVADTLASLPVDVRIAAEMHRFGGFTLEEVAEHLGISVATAHRHVRSALLAIASRIEQG